MWKRRLNDIKMVETETNVKGIMRKKKPIMKDGRWTMDEGEVESHGKR